MKKKQVTILSHDVSGNCLGRAYILAKALADSYEVEVVGPARGAGLWPPVAGDTSIRYTALSRFPSPRAYLRAIQGDYIYAVKPRMGSFGYGLLAKLCTRKKLVLDIDDWEMGLNKDMVTMSCIRNGLRFYDIDNTFYTWLMDKLIPFADSITVSNTFLQKKFGGVLVPHFRDTDAFDPAKFDRDAIRERLDVADKKVVMFMGTIRAHKGIDTLVRAFDELGRDDVVLMLVGVSDEAKHALPRRPYLRVFGFQPFEKVPEFLEAADMVALMQKSGTSSAQGQLPAKLFDAMSMAKPILATRVSDIPAILDGCGVVLNDTPSDLAAAIRSVLDNPEAAAAMGAAARRRCVEEYSYRAMRPRLSAVFADLAGDSAPSR